MRHSQYNLIASALQYNATQQILAADFDSRIVTELRRRFEGVFSSIPQLTHVHTDARRSIDEYNWTDFSVQSFQVHSANVPLGNHYHKKSVGIEEDSELGGLSEMFVFDEGSGLMLTQGVNAQGSAFGKIMEMKIQVGDILVIPPYRAHTLFMDNGTKFRAFRPYPFDERDKDLNPHTLELPK